MPNSIVSLEPLSSPSPSPPPPEANNTSGAGFDTDSELSDLTEDEQENDTRTNDDDSDEVRNPTRTKRRKRGGIVPEPMWGWAKPKKDEPKHKVVEEEEEEEQAGPAKALEEEEDDEELGSSPAPIADDPADKDDGEDEILEDEDDEEDEKDVGEAQVQRAEDDEDEDDDVLSEEDEEEPQPEDDVDDAPLQPAAQDSAPTDDEGEDKPPNPDDAYAPSPSPAGDMEDEDDHIAATPVPSITSKVPDTTPGPAEVKVTTPAVVPLISPVVPAPSSIMAGSQLIAPVPSSPSSSSASGTPHVSPFPSRTPTPEPVSDRETGPKPASRRAKNTRTTRPIRARGRRKLKYEASDHEGDADHATGDIDDRDGMEDDMDMDSPDMEMESDLLPVHRAEALDVLAQIELKFAQLRERIYVEKMEDLAWEEALVAEGTHPEMHHLHTELSKRRDKRLELASRRRDYEVSNVNKRRRLDEVFVWSWWKNTKDGLQGEMIAETNRKRRKLERERRAADRPPLARRIPGPPTNAPNVQTLRDIVKTYPYDPSATRENMHLHPKKQTTALVYPQLTTLAPEEIMSDLDRLWQVRRPAPFDYPRPGMMPPNSMFGGPPGPPPFDPFNMMVDGRYPPPQPPMQHIQGPPGFIGPGMGPGPGPRMGGAHPHPMVEGEMLGMGPPPGQGLPPHHMQQFPPNLRRSMSPVPMHSLSNGQGGPGPSGGGSKPHGWVGIGGPGGEREAKRPNGAHHELIDRDIEGMKMLARDRNDRNVERDRERELERDREQRESEHDLDRSHHMQHGPPPQSSFPHPSQHIHPSNSRQSHVHGSTHHHHHHHHHQHPHHVVHRHFSNGPGPSQNPNGPPPPGAPAPNGVPGNLSPRTQRELELRRPHSGPPTEVIELNSAGLKHMIPSPQSSWKGEDRDRDRDRPSSSDLSRDRDRVRQPPQSFGPPPSLGPMGPHERSERSGGPFVMTPAQATQLNIPPSPRGMHGPGPNPPGPGVRSRRGSWSTNDDGVPRPSSSSASMGLSPSGHPSMHPGHRHSGSTGSQMGGGRHPQGSPLMPPQSARTPLVHSPPRSTNGLNRLAPTSPSSSNRLIRSPVRMSQPLPMPASTSMQSPKLKSHRQSPPPPMTRSPLTRDLPNPSIPPLNPPSMTSRTSSPLTMFPPSQLSPHSSIPSGPPPSRLPPVQDKHSPSLPTNPPPSKLNVVPIDGS